MRTSMISNFDTVNIATIDTCRRHRTTDDENRSSPSGGGYLTTVPTSNTSVNQIINPLQSQWMLTSKSATDLEENGKMATNHTRVS